MEVDNSGCGDGYSSVSVLWVEVSCGDVEYCWLLCYQIVPVLLLVIIDIVSNTSLGRLTLDPASMHCPA